MIGSQFQSARECYQISLDQMRKAKRMMRTAMVCMLISLGLLLVGVAELVWQRENMHQLEKLRDEIEILQDLDQLRTQAACKPMRGVECTRAPNATGTRGCSHAFGTAADTAG